MANVMHKRPKGSISATSGIYEAENCQPKNEHAHKSPHSKSIKLDAVMAQQNCQCMYCYCTLNRSDAAVDHEVPRKFANKVNHSDNNMLCCKKCKQEHKGQSFDKQVNTQNNNGNNRMFTRSMKH